MPATFSHPVAILPLRRFCPRHLDFAALVIGTMTPDVGYFVRRFDVANAAHTTAGSIVVCLPTGALLLAAFYVWRRAFVFLLPQPHRAALTRLLPEGETLPLSRIPILAMSLLLGAWTHNVWDSFTHASGWFVQRIAFLAEPLIALGENKFHGYYLLQQLSTLLGAAVLVLVYWRWLRTQPRTAAIAGESDRWRYLLWAAIVLAPLPFVIPAAARLAARYDGYLAVRVFVFRSAIYYIAAFTLLVMLATSVVLLARRAFR